MNTLTFLKTRAAARADSEHEQAILRIMIYALVLAFMGLTYSPDKSDGRVSHCGWIDH
jgi:hypothetical protein